MAEIKITKDNFESEVIASDIPVILDFFATWCGPCRMLAPEIEEIAKEFDGKIKVGKVDVDEQPELCDKFGITSVPTVIIFKDGKPAHTSVGYKTKEQLLELI